MNVLGPPLGVRGCATLASPLQTPPDFYQNLLQVCQNLLIGEPNDFYARCFNSQSSFIVVFLLVGVKVVLAIHFNSQFCFVAIEVNDLGTDSVLVSEPESIQLP
jgi:hypothetical protein